MKDFIISLALVIAALTFIVRILAWPVAFALSIWFLAGYAFGEELIEPTPQEAADIATWIPAQCCRTNGCCRKVPESALIQLPNNQVRVASTGQVIARTGWSQDRNTWRCTCDLIDGKWVVHPLANTRCVFPIHSGS